MKSIRQCKQVVNPTHRGTHRASQGQAQVELELSPISLWNSLFPDDEISIDLITADNSSKSASPPSPPSLSELGKISYLVEFYNSFYSDDVGILVDDEGSGQGDNSSKKDEGSSQGDNSSKKDEGLGQGDNSSKIEDVSSQGAISSKKEEENPSGLSEFVPPFFSEEQLAEFAESWGLPSKVVQAAYRKLVKFPECGKHGGLMVGYEVNKDKQGRFSGEVVDLVLHPLSCNSVHCHYCQFRHSRKRLSEIISYFINELNSGKSLTFITLTVPSTHDIGEAVKRAKKLMERLYQLRFRGLRVQKWLRKLFAEELASYCVSVLCEGVKGDERARLVVELVPYMELLARYAEFASQVEDKGVRQLEQAFSRIVSSSSLSRYFSEDWQKRAQKVFRQLYFYADFCSRLAGVGRDVKLGQYLSAVWKFEITYNPEHGYHPHWHGITNFLVPKLYLTAICRYLGFGEVNDIRLVRGRQGVVELSKYETKPWELPLDDEIEVLKREAFLHGFKKLRVWNLEAQEERKRDFPVVLYFGVPLRICSYVLLDRPSLRSLPQVYHSLRKRALREGRDNLRVRFGQVRISASFNSRVSFTSFVYLGLDAELHIPVSDEPALQVDGNPWSTRDFALELINAYEDFVGLSLGYTFWQFVERRLAKLGLLEQKDEKTQKVPSQKVETEVEEEEEESLVYEVEELYYGADSSSSFSCSSCVFEARRALLNFLDEFNLYVGLDERFASYKEEIDALFCMPSYWFDEELQPSVRRLLEDYRLYFSSLLEALRKFYSQEARQLADTLSYLLSRIEEELQNLSGGAS